MIFSRLTVIGRAKLGYTRTIGGLGSLAWLLSSRRGKSFDTALLEGAARNSLLIVLFGGHKGTRIDAIEAKYGSGDQMIRVVTYRAELPGNVEGRARRDIWHDRYLADDWMGMEMMKLSVGGSSRVRFHSCAILDGKWLAIILLRNSTAVMSGIGDPPEDLSIRVVDSRDLIF